jgi:hypothetical protein
MNEQTKLSEIESSILLKVACADKPPSFDELAKMLGLKANADRQKLTYYLKKLKEREYIEYVGIWSDNQLWSDGQNHYGLDDKGRAYLVENNLI